MQTTTHSRRKPLVDRVVWALSAMAIVALGIMIVSALIQVVMRYGFRSPPVWTEELARYAMVWAGLLGAVSAFFGRADPVLVMGWSTHKDWRAKFAGFVRAIGVTVFMGPIVWYSVFGSGMNVNRGFLARTAGRHAEMLEIPMIWVSAIVPLAMVVIIALAWIQAIAGDTGVSDAG